MRMNADTMQRNGIVYSTARDMLSYSNGASVELIAAISGYSAKDVEKAIKSLEKQGVMDTSANTVIEVRPFKRA